MPPAAHLTSPHTGTALCRVHIQHSPTTPSALRHEAPGLSDGGLLSYIGGGERRKLWSQQTCLRIGILWKTHTQPHTHTYICMYIHMHVPTYFYTYILYVRTYVAHLRTAQGAYARTGGFHTCQKADSCASVSVRSVFFCSFSSLSRNKQ